MLQKPGLNLNLLQDEEVIALFSSAAAKLGMEHGIEAVRIVRDPTSNLGKGFGFVLFSSQPALRAALSLNDAKLRNRPVRVTKVRHTLCCSHQSLLENLNIDMTFTL